MAIIVNDTSIPTNGNYINVGNVNIDKVICNGVEVWKKQSDPITYGVSQTPSIFPNRWATTTGLPMHGTDVSASEFRAYGHSTVDEFGTATISTGLFSLPSGAKRVQFTLMWNLWGEEILSYAGVGRCIQTGEQRIYSHTGQIIDDRDPAFQSYQDTVLSNEFDVDGYTDVEFQFQSRKVTTGTFSDGSSKGGYDVAVCFVSMTIFFV